MCVSFFFFSFYKAKGEHWQCLGGMIKATYETTLFFLSSSEKNKAKLKKKNWISKTKYYYYYLSAAIDEGGSSGSCTAVVVVVVVTFRMPSPRGLGSRVSQRDLTNSPPRPIVTLATTKTINNSTMLLESLGRGGSVHPRLLHLVNRRASFFTDFFFVCCCWLYYIIT